MTLTDSGWIDISVPMRDGMVHWPGDQPFAFTLRDDFAKGDSHRLSAISLGSHSGTHIDAPAHFLQSGKTMDDYPISATNGPARVIEALGDRVSADDISRHGLRRGERVLIKTRNSSRPIYERSFTADFVSLTVEAARYLAERETRCVSVDYLSVGPYKGDGQDIHLALLEAGVWIVEGLDLSQVVPGRYEFICLPLRVAGAEGAPARAAVRPRGRQGSQGLTGRVQSR